LNSSIKNFHFVLSKQTLQFWLVDMLQI